MLIAMALNAAVREAYEEGLPLIEICTAGYAHPN
jgi:hypothetical protein